MDFRSPDESIKQFDEFNQKYIIPVNQEVIVWFCYGIDYVKGTFDINLSVCSQAQYGEDSDVEAVFILSNDSETEAFYNISPTSSITVTTMVSKIKIRNLGTKGPNAKVTLSAIFSYDV